MDEQREVFPWLTLYQIDGLRKRRGVEYRRIQAEAEAEQLQHHQVPVLATAIPAYEHPTIDPSLYEDFDSDNSDSDYDYNYNYDESELYPVLEKQ